MNATQAMTDSSNQFNTVSNKTSEHTSNINSKINK